MLLVSEEMCGSIRSECVSEGEKTHAARECGHVMQAKCAGATFSELFFADAGIMFG